MSKWIDIRNRYPKRGRPIEVLHNGNMDSKHWKTQYADVGRTHDGHDYIYSNREVIDTSTITHWRYV